LPLKFSVNDKPNQLGQRLSDSDLAPLLARDRVCGDPDAVS
jgi:hypothetical protein